MALIAGLALFVAAVVITVSTGRPSQVELRLAPGGQIRGGVGALPASVAATPPTDGIRPETLQIRKLGIRAPVVPVRTDGRVTLGVPDDPHLVGWWRDGAEPGSRRGTAIIVGHVNTVAAGPGAFWNLDGLQLGDRVVIGGEGGRIRFRVIAIRQYQKARLPARRAFSQHVPGRIALVSCAGPVDTRTGHYRDNIVAYAAPESGVIQGGERRRKRTAPIMTGRQDGNTAPS